MLKTCSAKKYEVSNGYLFPFILFDPTPGGSNLGRIEWNIEIYKTRKNKISKTRSITQILVWARQTKDAQYLNKFFLLNCDSVGIMTHHDGDDFLHNVGFMQICDEHKMPILCAYPRDGSCALYIEAYSSVGTRIRFLTVAEVKVIQER
jgi:hypothetical protein